MGAVILVVGLAYLTLQASPNLSSDANTVSNLDSSHFIADFDGLPDDFMAHTDRQACFSPSASDCMDITTTNTACFNLNVNISLVEGLWFVL